MPVINAIRISMNIPMYFTKIQHNGDYYVDGFLLMNFPLYYFDEPSGWLPNDSTQLENYFQNITPNNKTLGIMTLEPDESLDNSNLVIDNLSSYVSAILNTMLNNIQQKYIKNDLQERSIIIKLPFKIDPTDFQPTTDTQQKLLQAGFDTAKEYLEIPLVKPLVITPI
jgi:predicted acylesterase/phospholipase RssA